MGRVVHHGTPASRYGRRTHRPELRSDRGEGHETPFAQSLESGPASEGYFNSSGQFISSGRKRQRFLSHLTNRPSSICFLKGVLIMFAPATIGDYLRAYGQALGDLVLARFPALHSPDDPVWPALQQLKRRPFPAHATGIMGVVKRW